MDLTKRMCFLVSYIRVLTVQNSRDSKADSAKLAPSVKLNIIFSASNKLNKLSKLKCKLPITKQTNVIYKVACENCTEFYIGKNQQKITNSS